jgi:hypothetical protein
MNRIRRICRPLACRPRQASAMLASAAAAPAVLRADPPLPLGWNKHPPLPAHARAVVIGGMPGWQIIIILVLLLLLLLLLLAAAALLADALALTTYRTRATRRRVTARPAARGRTR